MQDGRWLWWGGDASCGLAFVVVVCCCCCRRCGCCCRYGRGWCSSTIGWHDDCPSMLALTHTARLGCLVVCLSCCFFCFCLFVVVVFSSTVAFPSIRPRSRSQSRRCQSVDPHNSSTTNQLTMSILSRAAASAVRRVGSTFARHQRAAFSTRRLETAQASSLLDIGTRPIFDETHDQFREMTRKFYAEQVVPFHSEWEDQVRTN